MALHVGVDKEHAIQRELRRLALLVLVRAEQNVAAARRYESVHFGVGSVAAGLAVAAGGTAFAGETVFAAVIAGVAGVVSGALTGYLTVRRPEERTASHWRAARDYGKLYDALTLYMHAGWIGALDDLQPGSEPQLAPAQQADGAQANSARTPDDEAPAALARFMKRAAEIEDASFPVPRRLCRLAESQIASSTEWIPPSGDEFGPWRRRLYEPPPRFLRSRPPRRYLKEETQ